MQYKLPFWEILIWFNEYWIVKEEKYVMVQHLLWCREILHFSCLLVSLMSSFLGVQHKFTLHILGFCDSFGRILYWSAIS